jgi:hypothetical protein
MNRSPDPGPEHDGHTIQGAERRAWARYPRRLQTLWQLFGSRDTEVWTSYLHDISQTGIGLLLDRAFPASTVLSVRIQTAARKTTRSMLVRVRHCTARPDGPWLVGCTFIVKLRDEELRELIADPPAPSPQISGRPAD